MRETDTKLHSSSLASVTVSSDNPVYDSREGCNAIIETSTNTLFAGCQNTTIPESVTGIGDYAFQNCIRLASISIPASLTSIGDCAFSIVLPESVTRIGKYAFAGCPFFYVICRAENVPELGQAAFSSVPLSEATLYVPASALEDYKHAEGWKEFETILPIKKGTGIDSPAAWSEDDNANGDEGCAAPYFTLDGKRVSAPVRGGKKVLY